MKTFYEQTIIDNIEFSGYGDDVEKFIDYPLYNKIAVVYSIFKKEYIHDNNKFMNEEILFKEWLQGLPSVLTVPFYNYRILENAKKAGFSFETEQQENRFLDAYWSRLSNAFFTLKNNL
jgi:hypothetical protein